MMKQKMFIINVAIVAKLGKINKFYLQEADILCFYFFGVERTWRRIKIETKKMMQIEIDAITATVFFILLLLIALIGIILAVSLINGGKNSLIDKPIWLVGSTFPNSQDYFIVESNGSKFAFSNTEKILYVFNSTFPPDYILLIQNLPFNFLTKMESSVENGRTVLICNNNQSSYQREIFNSESLFTFSSIPWG